MNKSRLVLAAVILTLAFVVSYVLYRITPTYETDWETKTNRLNGLKNEQIRLSELLRIEGQDKSCRNDDDCQLVPLGPEVCGYPRQYFMYSTFNTNVEIINQLVSEFDRAARDYANETVKNLACGKPILPVKCIDGVCQFSKKI